MSKRRYLLEKAESLPESIFEAEDKPADSGEFTIFRIGSPVDKESTFGKVCEPDSGWGKISEDDLKWTRKG